MNIHGTAAKKRRRFFPKFSRAWSPTPARLAQEQVLNGMLRHSFVTLEGCKILQKIVAPSLSFFACLDCLPSRAKRGMAIRSFSAKRGKKGAAIFYNILWDHLGKSEKLDLRSTNQVTQSLESDYLTSYEYERPYLLFTLIFGTDFWRYVQMLTTQNQNQTL